MGSYPTSPRAAFLEWCQTHAPIFTDNAAEIGLTEAQATAFAATTTLAAARALAQDAAKQAQKVATQEANDTFAELRAGAGDAVRSIRAFAELQAKPNDVYNLAQISPPAPPSPAPPPAQPTDLTVTLDSSSGNLLLKWKATNPAGTSGTSYIIRRKLPGETAFTFLGVAGTKEFVDETLIAGPDSVQYTVQGQRGASSGPLSPIFVVNFGQAPGGGFVATVTSTPTPSTVDGRMVQKMTPGGNGRTASSRM
jgi:hypothetical protein